MAHSEEVGLVGERGRRRTRGDAQLGEDVAHVPVDRPLAETQLHADRAVGQTLRDEPEHLELAAGQEAVPGRSTPVRDVQGPQVGHRAESLESARAASSSNLAPSSSPSTRRARAIRTPVRARS